MLLFKKTTKTAGDLATELGVLLKDSTNEIWTSDEKIGALKQAVRKLYPEVFVPLVDTSLSTDINQFEYQIPDAFDNIIGVDVKYPAVDAQWQGVPFTTQYKDGANYIVFNNVYDSGMNIRIRGGSRLTVPESTTTPMDFSIDAEDIAITGAKIEMMEMILLDKGKMNQFAAREVGVTEVDVINMINGMKRDYANRKGEISTLLIAQITRI